MCFFFVLGFWILPSVCACVTHACNGEVQKIVPNKRILLGGGENPNSLLYMCVCVCVCVCVCTNLHGQCGNILYEFSLALSLYIYSIMFYFYPFKNYFKKIFIYFLYQYLYRYENLVWYYLILYIYIYIIYGTMILLERTSISISSGHLLKFSRIKLFNKLCQPFIFPSFFS